MRLRPLLFAAGLALTAGAASLCGSRAGYSPALASGDGSSPGPTVAILAGMPGGEHTSLYLVEVGGREAAPAPVATLAHAAGAVVRGSVVPGTRVVLAVADGEVARDASFNASLFRIEPHAPPERLVDRVVHASRPLVTPAGRVFVSRGVAGVERSEMGGSGGERPPNSNLAGAGRVDELSVDEVDVTSGAARTIHTHSGFLTFLAGSIGDEILLYRIGPSGADLVAVEADTGQVRVVLADMLPYARDFSVDEAAGRVVFVERHETRRTTWVVDSADLATGARTRLAEGESMALAPHVWPGGGVALSPGGRSGLSLLGGSAPLSAPLGAGADLVLAISPDARWVGALHTVPSTLPVAFAIESATGKPAAVAAPPGARVTIAGFVPASAQGGAK